MKQILIIVSLVAEMWSFIYRRLLCQSYPEAGASFLDQVLSYRIPFLN
jgi:hypothetical protein